MATLRPHPVIFRLSLTELEDTVIVREKIMDVIKQRLARIQITNGYYCDCGTDVQEGKLVGLTPPTPSLNVWDGGENAERVHRTEINTLTITIELYEKGTATATSESIARVARRMGADVRRAIMWNHNYEKVDPSLDGLAEGIKYKASDLVLGFNPESWTGVIMEYEVTYITISGNPFRSKE